MKLTESHLRDIIEEEIEEMIETGELDEGILDRLAARAKGAAAGVGSKIKSAQQQGLGKLAGLAGADDAAASLSQAAAATKAQGAKKAQATRALSVLGAHMKRMNTDITKLGLDEDPKIKQALEYLERAIQSAAAKAGAQYQRTAAREE